MFIFECLTLFKVLFSLLWFICPIKFFDSLNLERPVGDYKETYNVTTGCDVSIDDILSAIYCRIEKNFINTI